MKYVSTIISSLLCIALLLSFASCGSKKAKLRAENSTAVSVNDDDDEVLDDEAVIENVTEKYTGSQTVIKRHSYELSDYNGMNYNTVVDYQYYYAQKRVEEFEKLRLYLESYYAKNCKNGDQITFLRRMQSEEKSTIEIDSKQVTDSNVLSFFSELKLITSVRYHEAGSVKEMNCEFILPSFVTFFDYSITMNFHYSSLNSADIESLPSVSDYKAATNGWYYYVSRVDEYVIREES